MSSPNEPPNPSTLPHIGGNKTGVPDGMGAPAAPPQCRAPDIYRPDGFPPNEGWYTFTPPAAPAEATSHEQPLPSKEGWDD